MIDTNIFQERRLLELDTPLGSDVLLISGLKGREGISSLFTFELDMVTPRASAHKVLPDKLIGKKAALHIAEHANYDIASRRHISGIVTNVSVGFSERDFAHFRMDLVPWLWLLTLRQDCRIFQNLSVLEIVHQIFDEFRAKFPDLVLYKDQTQKHYTKLDYCVQYRESSFDFISRLLEQEGIFYYFDHEPDRHTLVLADQPSTPQPLPGVAAQPRYVPDAGWGPDDAAILRMAETSRIHSGKVTLRDWHMQFAPRPLEVNEPTKYPLASNSELEIYDYPGYYASRFIEKARQGEVRPEGETLSAWRIEENELPRVQIAGDSISPAFTPGCKIEVTDHELVRLNANYLLAEVTHNAVQDPPYRSEQADSAEIPYQNNFLAVPADVPFRPPRRTPKPIVQGPQTALVVGPKGNEIYTDEFSRIKVQFHWDRLGSNDEKSSCWVRVSQPWAGAGWGSVSVPRIGQEVIVDFLEGDPDQPVVTGKVYNADQMPPYPLPAQAMVAGLKTRSTPGGGGYNEMAMDDTKGKELIRIHAQYDMATTVEHDETHIVHNNRKVTVDVDHTENVGNNQKVDVGVNQTESVGSNRDTAIGSNDKLEVGANMDHTIGANRTVSVSGKDELTVTGSETIDVKGPISVKSVASITLEVGASSITLTPASITLSAPLIKLN